MTVVWRGTVGMGVQGNHKCTVGLRARVEVKEGQLPNELRKSTHTQSSMFVLKLLY